MYLIILHVLKKVTKVVITFVKKKILYALMKVFKSLNKTGIKKSKYEKKFLFLVKYLKDIYTVLVKNIASLIKVKKSYFNKQKRI